MADYTVTAKLGSPAFALVANTVSTVTFDADLNQVEVINATNAEVWWTCDGSTPDPATGNGYYIPTTGIDRREPPTSGVTVVKLISAATPTVRVQRG